jgi:hypothetical protein
MKILLQHKNQLALNKVIFFIYKISSNTNDYLAWPMVGVKKN